MKKRTGQLFSAFFVLLAVVSAFPLTAQTHISVPVDEPVYYLLEQAQLRGLCAPLSGAKPYSRATVLAAIDEILSADENRRFGALNEDERSIFKTAQKKYGTPKPGLDWKRGGFYSEKPLGKTDIHTSLDIGFEYDMVFSNAFYPTSNKYAWGLDAWLSAFLRGDLGSSLSYDFKMSGGFIGADRPFLGTYNTLYDGYVNSDPGPDPSSVNQTIGIYGDPRGFFPYTYKKRWTGFVVDLSTIFGGTLSSGAHQSWPKVIAFGYDMNGEAAGTLFAGHFTYRFGRLDREWGAMSNGSSLVLNQSAQPFLAAEMTVSPLSWLTFSSLTGILEYFNEKGLKESAKTNQNAFSMSLFEINIKQYFHFDIGSTSVWTKRFELGYLFPLIDNFLYQDNIGDFDNMAMFMSFKGQYPGVANLWLSAFMDEVSPELGVFKWDRAMFAYQAGTTVHLPFLSFASISIRYTKIEPYNYTHPRTKVPWYDSPVMETSYTNNGRGLGYYLQPNSDELLVQFQAMPGVNTRVHVQYQMIRHGADYGGSAVDGSSYWSELDPDGRSENPVLRKFFLHDGAYQWQHIVRVGAEHTFAKISFPLTLFGEFGMVFSHFTNVSGAPNSGRSSSYSIIDTAEYPKSIGIVASVGLRFFP